MNGQITITDYLASKIAKGEVMNLTQYINSQGKSQYRQISEIIKNTYESVQDKENLVDRLTNAVSLYVLDQ